MWQRLSTEIRYGIDFLERYSTMLSIGIVSGIIVAAFYAFMLWDPYYLGEVQIKEKTKKELLILQTSNIVMQIDRVMEDTFSIASRLDETYMDSKNDDNIVYKMHWLNYHRDAIVFSVMAEGKERVLRLLNDAVTDDNITIIQTSQNLSVVKALSREYIFALGMVLSVLGMMILALEIEYWKYLKFLRYTKYKNV